MIKTQYRFQQYLVGVALVASLLSVNGCTGSSGEGGGGGERKFLSMGTAPVGGVFQTVGNALVEVLNNEQPAEVNWKFQAKGTKGSQENIRRLDAKEIDFALSNAAITYFAARGEGGWDKKYPMRSVMTLAPNVAMFITLEGSGVKSIADLKGKRVVIGPSGAGFEMFVGPIIEAHGVSFDDFTPLNSTQSNAVDQLGDGSASAAFLGGAVPTASIIQACSTFDVVFVPFDEAARQKLIQDFLFFKPATIAKDKYSDLTADFEGLNVGSMHLITFAEQDENLVYQLTKTIYQNRQDVAKRHPAGNAINPKNVVLDTGTEFHPGAIRFYKEIGIWPEASEGAESQPKPANDAPAEETNESS